MSRPFRFATTCVWALVCVCFCACFCACEYDREFDTLSAFPANAQRKTVDEIEFVAVEAAEANDDAKLLAIDRAVVEPISNEPSVIKPAAGVKGIPFVQSSTQNSGSFVRLDEYLTGIPAIEKRVLNKDESDLLSTPFCSVGIAVGNLVGDSLPDIFVADQQTGGRLFENGGDFGFKEVTEIAGLKQSKCWGVAPILVDINNDGLLDIYLCCYKSPNRLFINRGRKFAEQAEQYGLNFRGASAGAGFADFDRDGDLDLYLVTHRLPPTRLPDKLPVDREPGKPPRIKEEYREANHLIEYKDGRYVPVESGQYDRVYLNDGNKFTDMTETGIVPKEPYRGNAARCFDFNDDGWPDIFVANDKKDPDLLLKNLGLNSDGEIQFQDVTKEMLATTTWFSKSTSLSDLNGDGRLDLLVAGDAYRSKSKQAVSRGNLFGKDGDSWFLSGATPLQMFGNSAHVILADGPMVELAKALGISASGSTSAIATADFDSDGNEEIWFSNGAVRPFLDNDLNSALRQKPEDKSFEADDFWQKQKTVADVDVVCRKNSTGEFEAVNSDWEITQASLVRASATSDLDNDGDIDVVTIDHNGEIVIFKNGLEAENSIQIQLVGQDGNRFGLGATIKVFGAGETEMVRYVSTSGSFLSSQSPTIHFGVGNIENVGSVEIDWPRGNKQTLNSLATNYKYEIQEPNSSRAIGRGLKMELGRSLFVSQEVELSELPQQELPFDDFEQQPMLPFKFSQLGPGHAWGDIDGDGDDDLFVGGAAFEKSMLFENKGKFEFAPLATDAFDNDFRCEDMGAVFFDLEGDGDVDLFVVSGGVESKLPTNAMLDRLYLNDGNGNFEKSTDRVPEYRASGGPVSVVDFDRDGQLDVFVGGRVVPGNFPAIPQSVLLKNKNGKLELASEEVAPGLSKTGMVTGSCWADVDGDGWNELMLTCQLGSTKCFQNVRGKLIDVSERAGLAQQVGFFNSLIPGDIDNDGDTDFVVGNFGTNTQYRATAEEPYRLQRLKFNKAETLLESYSVSGKRYPLRSLDLFQRNSVAMFESYKNSEQFSRLEIDQLIADSGAQPVQQIEANAFESGVWINESNSAGIQFRFEALPLLAQSSPIFGGQLVDVDADGFLDLFAVQNLLEVNPLIERFGSGRGLLLVGDGTGKFQLPEIDGGVVVRGSGRSATTVDLNSDGRCDLVAATSGDGFKFFANKSRHVPFAIDMRQASEGKSYLGAKVILTFVDGSQQLHQITSNSGYLSQSAPIVYSGLKNNKDVDTIRIDWPDGSTQTGSVNSLLRNR